MTYEQTIVYGFLKQLAEDWEEADEEMRAERRWTQEDEYFNKH